ncbi:DUF1615 domain-containing protein [Moraxella bovis]|uniref:DUF1615 domain-containing protein n=1 Tax=Moraxella bovis TaxID=476 RepID=UPI002225FDCE|nr:DUF1615 domain-containing protein [Moraxella bovis]UYZ68977.1 DUF1615 domain-containing protein [Moraxella bovis]UYZ71351.1 DUF1615 domain-containing protein [Moraxella bovis]UYZ72736.1 DUF1615 domain-containing protein [Moraxella bovis]UYZ94918.1 DUF1615 domain-containing protein [Moraxella bovis]UZA14644.1 DUF1615 domain-containing protein [Moraxella bovis]
MKNPLLKNLSLYIALFGGAILLTACTQETPDTPILSDDEIAKVLPNRSQDKASWASDIGAIFDELKLHKDKENICTVVAVIDQESNFHANPAVANLGQASLRAIDDKLEDKLGKQLAGVFRTMLATRPTKDNSFESQIKKVKTEKELDELYQQMFDYFASTYKVSGVNNLTKLTGESLDERLNPITTLGSMQVHVNYAKRHRRANMNDRTLRADMYGQYGGLYYGIHRLMMYQADYDKPLYRFADYNSGVYSSRNSAFQKRVASLTGISLDIDGDLLLYANGTVSSAKSQTETALINLLATAKTPLTPAQIRSDLKKEKKAGFEQTATYQGVSELFKAKYKKDPTYAIMPQVVISSTKMKQDKNTNWYATNVNRRYEACMTLANKLGK